MIFFRRRQYPDFWEKYVNQNFSLPKDINQCNFVVFDTETTGFSKKEDRILSIGAIKIQNQIFEVNDIFEIYLKQDVFKPNTVEIHGITQHGNYPKISELLAIEKFISYIGNSVLVAHNADFDIQMVNQVLKRLSLPNLKNRVIDTDTLFKMTKVINPIVFDQNGFSLDHIAKELHVEIEDRHTAVGDAYITAMIFMKIVLLLRKKHKILNSQDLLQKNRRGFL